MSELFKSINADGDPGDQNPTLAENYRHRTPEMLLPGDVVHPFVYSAIAKDEGSQKLYINSMIEFGLDADNPSDYSNRFGIMRICQAIEGKIDDELAMHDGFLVDLRSVQPDQIETIDASDMDESGFDDEEMFGRPMPVIGYIYLDADGDTAYNGRDDPRIIESAMYLRDVVDIVRDPVDEEANDGNITMVDAAPDKTRQPKFIAPGDKVSESDMPPEAPSHTRES